MEETQSSPPITMRLGRIAEAARQHPERAFTTSAHHIDLAWLREVYQRTSKDGAPGIDGQTAEQYARKLEENILSLMDRVKSGRYRAPAVRGTKILLPWMEPDELGPVDRYASSGYDKPTFMDELERIMLFDWPRGCL